MVNGKEYPLWEQIVEKKENLIGKRLVDEDMGMVAETIVEDVILRPNGEDSAYFEIVGKDFSCGFDVQHGGIIPDENYLVFGSFYGGTYTIK